MTELIDTCGAMRKEPKVDEGNDGGTHVRADPNKRRSTDEATSEDFPFKKTKLNSDGNSARRAKRWGNKNRKGCGRGDVSNNDAPNNVKNVNANGHKRRRGSKNKKRRHFAQKQLKPISTNASPGAIVNLPSNKPNGNAFPMNDLNVNGQSKSNSSQKSIRNTKNNLTNNAPFNSTQFLMNDHENDALQYLDSALGVRRKDANSAASSIRERPIRRINRARDSSFSLDSDEDFYYSSPEDEEDFVNQEFIKEYDNVRTNRLVDMPKAELIQEYLLMENRVDSLEKRLNLFQNNSNIDTPPDTSPENETNNLNSDAAERIRKFQRQIGRLESENERLRQVMREQGSIPYGTSAVETNYEALMEGTPSDDDSVSSCSTCNTSASSSSSSSSSSRSSSPIENEVDSILETNDSTSVISSIDVLGNIAQKEQLIEMEGDDDKENAEVECSEQVSENLVSSTGP